MRIHFDQDDEHIKNHLTIRKDVVTHRFIIEVESPEQIVVYASGLRYRLILDN